MKLVLFACLVFTVACAKSKSDKPPPYQGAPTVDRVANAKKLVTLRDDWDAAIAKIEAEAGPATTKTADKAAWAVTDGTACASLTIERKDDHVRGVADQPKILKADFPHVDGSANNFEDCEAAAHAK